MIKIITAVTQEHYSTAAKLFNDYAVALGIDLSFQNFEKELKDLPLQYGAPKGRLLLAYHNDKAIGCVGVRALEYHISELKRMYIKPEGRGLGLGTILLKASLQAAEELGYSYVRLDTLPEMKAAIHLYESHGFYLIKPYRYNPMENALFYEKQLNK